MTGNVVKDPEGGYAAFFDEFPEIIAEGASVKEAKENLIEALREVLHYRKLSTNSKNQAPRTPREAPSEVKHFELQIA